MSCNHSSSTPHASSTSFPSPFHPASVTSRTLPVEQKAPTNPFQPARSWASQLGSFQIFPASFMSSSTVVPSDLLLGGCGKFSLPLVFLLPRYHVAAQQQHTENKMKPMGGAWSNGPINTPLNTYFIYALVFINSICYYLAHYIKC